MPKILNFFTSFFFIDRSKTEATPIKIDVETGDLKHWVITLIRKIVEVDKKAYVFDGDNVQVLSSIREIINGEEKDKYSRLIANRYLHKEQDAQHRIRGMKEIPLGNLVIIFFELDGRNHVTISKVDQAQFLDQDSFTKRSGLPFERQVFKACLIVLGPEEEVENIFIYDNNAKISEYWWKEFLETRELNNNEKNTENAFNCIERCLRKHLRKSEADHTELLNSTIGYFRSNTEFSLDDYLDKVIESYVPEDPNLDIGLLKQKINELPGDGEEKINFDRFFTIEKGVIKKRFKRSIKLASDIELNLKTDIPDLDSRIRSYEKNNRKFVRIESEDGYKHFRKLEENEID